MTHPAAEVLQRLAAHAATHVNAPAVRSAHPCGAGACLTWGDLHRAVEGHAAALARSLAPRTVVVLMAPNAPAFVVAFLAVLRAGLRVFPILPTLTPREVDEIVRRSGAKAIVTEPGGPAPSGVETYAIDRFGRTASGEAPPDRPAGDLLLCSSGSTGRPKIVLRVGESLDAVARQVARAVGLSPDDRVLATIPLCHSYGVENGLLAPMYAGATVLVARGFDPATVGNALAHDATVFPGVPFMFEALADLRTPRPNGSLRSTYSAGAPLAAGVAERFAETCGVGVGQLYGATEIGSVTFAPAEDVARFSGTVGRPMDGVRIRIGGEDEAEGDVLVRAPSMLRGYVGSDDPPLVEGFFRTGDLGRVDANGRLFITGRAKLQIDVGGLKVNPLEVERVLTEHPSVAECVVVPLALTATVRRLRAVVVPSPGATVDGESLRRFARDRLAPHKVPRVFETCEALPKSPTGKVLRGRIQ